MQQAQKREPIERISWARAMIFATGFFLIAAILLGQFPGFIYWKVTAASLEELERSLLTISLTCLGGFAVIMAIVMLFDPKPLVNPVIFVGLGVILTLGGLALSVWSTTTGCSPTMQSCNQYFPSHTANIGSLLGGKFLWFQANSIDFLAIGLIVLGVGAAWIFYGVLAMRERTNPDRRDPGSTPLIRMMMIGGTLLLVIYMVFMVYVNTQGLANKLFPEHPFWGQRLIVLISSLVLGAAMILSLGSLLLRLHYLMRPVRKNTMAPLYAYGMLGLAQIGAVVLVIWVALYPLVAWIYQWSFIGLNKYLLICQQSSLIPASCSFSPQTGYLIDAIITSTFFAVLLAAIWAWKTKRNLVVIGSIITIAMIAFLTLLLHTSASLIQTALVLSVGILILGTIWTSTARREFAVVGENNLGCLGQWLVFGTCLFIYLASFAFFSLATFPNDAAENLPFVSGLIIGPLQEAGATTAVTGKADAIVVLLLMGIVAAVQFYFLSRNRYKA